MNHILSLIGTGALLGLGAELQFFLIYLGWHFLHSRIAHKYDSEHFFHKIHDYFSA